jgi:hypothetical protein
LGGNPLSLRDRKMRTHLPVTQAMAEMIGLRPDHFC